MGHIRISKESGVNMNGKKQLTLRMSDDLYEALLEIKNIKKISIPQLIISVVWKGIKEFSFIFQD